MITEAAAIAWFAAHPFTRSLALVALGTISATVKADYNTFVEAKKADPTLQFSSWVMMTKSLWSLITAVVVSIAPSIWAELIKILGGGVLSGP